MSELPSEVDGAAFFGFVMGLADLLRCVAELVTDQDAEVRKLSEDVADLGVRVGLESELRAGADETLRQEWLDLDRRLTDVHHKALKALNRRYTTGETA